MRLSLLSFAALAAAGPLVPRQDTTLTYQEFSPAAGIVYRLAVPAGATAPFDIALQIEAPINVGWAGIGFGGGMLNNPLVVAWANGDSVTASPRTAFGYQQPAPSNEATITLLPDAAANATHWTLSAICTGCSQWAAGSIDPSASSPLAWAYAASPPFTPADPDSAFGIHDDKGSVPFDFAAAAVEGFEEAVGV